ncbi:MAG: hypothetical protein IPP19_17120 [Verrucomicrobia bacterium]|nr:hypothetical protein [Verrucomicrobiota bacterium]
MIEPIGKTTCLFRPASGFGAQEQVAYTESKGYRAVVGTVFPLDHWISNSPTLEYLARWLCVSGGIVILHDGEIRGRTTAEVLDRLIPKLKAAGYEFGRLEDEMRVARGTARNSIGQ